METKIRKNVIPVFAALAVFGLLSATVVSAYGFGWMNDMDDDEREALRSAVESGDYDAWKAVMESEMSEENFESMQERHAVGRERREAIGAAFDAGDYGTWVEAVQMNGKAPRITEKVTEENFPLIVELHEVRQAGDTERVNEIREELGFPHGSCDGGGKGFGKGMHGMGMRNF